MFGRLCYFELIVVIFSRDSSVVHLEGDEPQEDLPLLLPVVFFGFCILLAELMRDDSTIISMWWLCLAAPRIDVVGAVI